MVSNGPGATAATMPPSGPTPNDRNCQTVSLSLFRVSSVLNDNRWVSFTSPTVRGVVQGKKAVGTTIIAGSRRISIASGALHSLGRNRTLLGVRYYNMYRASLRIGGNSFNSGANMVLNRRNVNIITRINPNIASLGPNSHTDIT